MSEKFYVFPLCVNSRVYCSFNILYIITIYHSKLDVNLFEIIERNYLHLEAQTTTLNSKKRKKNNISNRNNRTFKSFAI